MNALESFVGGVLGCAIAVFAILALYVWVGG